LNFKAEKKIDDKNEVKIEKCREKVIGLLVVVQSS
jgi:hypothetical protein